MAPKTDANGVLKELQALGSEQRQALFACGGSVAVAKPVRILFAGACKREEEAQADAPRPSVDVIEFPTQPEDRDGAMARMVAACDPATFGKGMETVLDTDYRSAFMMAADRWVTNFELSEYPILDEIRSMLAPDAAAVLAHPYKLDVYEKGGFFKSHMDTPRTGNVFGILVVCLPSPFDGGDFEIEHNGQTHAFAWEGEFKVNPESEGGSNDSETVASPHGSSPSGGEDGGEDDSDAAGKRNQSDGDGGRDDSPRPTKRSKPTPAAQPPQVAARWCAYYSDCSHQVLEVTSGYRVTLTYLLENVAQMPTGDMRALESNPFFNKLYELLMGSEITKGDRIGFALEHVYVVDANGTLPILKGFDRFLKYALEALQLTYSFEVVFLAEDLAESDDEDEFDEDESKDESEDDEKKEAGKKLDGDEKKDANKKLAGDAAFIGQWKTVGGAVSTGYYGDSVEEIARGMIGATGPERVIWIVPPKTKCYKVHSAMGHRDGQVSQREYFATAAFLVTI